jgi:hypothetical protein
MRNLIGLTPKGINKNSILRMWAVKLMSFVQRFITDLVAYPIISRSRSESGANLKKCSTSNPPPFHLWEIFEPPI